MFKRFFIRVAVALPALLLIAPLAGIAANLAFAPYHYKQKVEVKGKTELVAKTTAHYAEVSQFWAPLVVLLLVVLLVGIMIFVSHNKSRIVPGAIIGTAAALALWAFGDKLVPSGLSDGVFRRGVTFHVLVLSVLVVIVLAMSLADRLVRRHAAATS